MKALTIAVFIIGLTACASTGVKIDQSKVEALQKGKTTYSDVLIEFGKPSTSTITADGSRVAVYSYAGFQSHPENFIPIVGAFVGGADTEMSMVTMSFDQKGILRNYSATQGGNGSGYSLESLPQERRDVREVQ